MSLGRKEAPAIGETPPRICPIYSPGKEDIPCIITENNWVEHYFTTNLDPVMIFSILKAHVHEKLLIVK